MSVAKNLTVVTDDLFDEAMMSDDAWKMRPLPFTEALARSVRAHRDWVKSNHMSERWPSLGMLVIDNFDRDQAEDIRRYYLDRLMFKKLQTGQATEFAQQLYPLLLSESRPLQQHLGMLYRLPYFYAEDRAHDALAQRYADHQPEELDEFTALTQAFAAKEQAQRLRPVQQILRSRRSKEAIEFWFETEEGEPAMMSVATNNSLMTLMQGLFERPALMVHGYFTPTRQPGIDFTFYHLYHFSLDSQQFQ